jgi:hypothetical protein
MKLYLLNNKYFYFGCISFNIACKFKCYISKSKSVLSECNDLYFIAIAFIAFTLHEIKQCPVFFGTPGMPVGSIPAKGHLYTDVNSVF